MPRIVVGVDPSPAGRRALEWAVREALARGAELIAVRSWQARALVLGFDSAVYAELGDAHRQLVAEAQQVLDDELKLALDAVPGAGALAVSGKVVPVPAAHWLVEASAEADLVVVGSRGAGVLSRAVLGSVSSSVLHHASCPVAVVPEAAADEGVEPPRVLVGVDHSPHARAALRFAVEHARRHGAVLVPVHVHEPALAVETDLDLRGLDLRDLEGAERPSLLRAAADAGAGDLDVQPEVCTGHPSAVLNALARPQDVLVTGSRGRGGFLGLLLGSTSTQCAQHATCPVVVVREAARG